MQAELLNIFARNLKSMWIGADVLGVDTHALDMAKNALELLDQGGYLC